MMNMIMYEIKKLSLKKIALVGILILLLGMVYNFFSSYLYNDTYILTSDKSGIEAINGKEANEIRKQAENQFMGEVNELTITKIEQFLESEKQSISHLSKDQQTLYLMKYSNISSLKDIYNREIIFGYCRGWQKFIINFSNTFSVFIVIYLVVIFYKIFSCERENNVAEIVYSTKMARGKSVVTRISVVIVISLILYCIFYFVNLLMYMILYSSEGAKVSIQSIGVFSNSESFLSVGKLAIIMFVEGVLATCAISMIICVCSCYGKTIFSVLFSSLIIIMAPIFFNFTDILPVFQKVLELLPMYSLNIISKYRTTGLYHSPILASILSGIVSLLIILFGFLGIIQYFRHYSLQKNVPNNERR